MPKYKPQRSISPVVFVSGDFRYEGMGFSYGELGLMVRNKKPDEIILDARWKEIKRVTIVRNQGTLGTVHFILVLVFLRGIISAIFFPHIIFHLFYNTTIKWAGFLEIELKAGHLVRLTPAGWTRLGFHISESKLTYERMSAYTKLPDIEIIDYKDYENA